MLFIIVGCGNKHKKDTKIPPINVTVENVEYSLVTSRRSYIGVISPQYSASIQSRVNGYISEIYYKKSQYVSKGDLLIKVDPKQLMTQAEVAKANVTSAKAQLLEARNNYKRAIPLAKIEGISQSSLDQYEAVYKSAVASLSLAKSQLKNAQLNVSYTNIYSPISGIMGDNDLSIGDYIGPGSVYSELGTVESLDSICVGVAIPVKEYLKYVHNKHLGIKTYDDARLMNDITLTLSDGSVYPHKGSYYYTERDIASENGTIVIMTVFPNPDRSLRSGQYAQITAIFGDATNKITVPQSAVVQTQNLNNVWIVGSGNTAQYVSVELGETIGDRWVITKGLKNGDPVIVSGIIKLRNGAKVNVLNSKR